MSVGHGLDRLENVCCRRVHRLASLDDPRRAETLEEPPVAAAGTDGDEPGVERGEGRRSAALEQPFLALRGLDVHVRDLDALDHAERRAQGQRASGIVRVHVHLERGRVADDEQRVADLLEAALERVLVEPLALDDEHRAVAVLRELLVDRIEPERLRLDRRLGELLTDRTVDHPACDLDEPGTARVHDPRIAQDVEHLGRSREGVLPAREHDLQQLVGTQVAMLLPLALLGHLADDGEHRPLHGPLHRPVRRVARATEGTAQKGRADPFVLAEDLHEPADDLREDDSRVPARPHERRPGHVLGDGLAVGRPRRVEGLDDRTQRQREVRAGVPVRDGIDVEVVDPAAVGLEVLERAPREVPDQFELHQCLTPSM